MTDLIVITGPTASGKTGKAVALAKALDAEIISADSRQLYRGMDLGTGKDLEEYGDVPYHMIDICPTQAATPRLEVLHQLHSGTARHLLHQPHVAELLTQL